MWSVYYRNYYSRTKILKNTKYSTKWSKWFAESHSGIVPIRLIYRV